MHAESTIKQKEDLNMSVVDKKINSLTTHFEKYVSTLTEPMMNFMSTQKNLEDKINELRNENKNDLSKQIKLILTEMKEMYLNTTTADKSKPKEELEIQLKQDEEMGKMNKALLNMQQMIIELKSEKALS